MVSILTILQHVDLRMFPTYYHNQLLVRNRLDTRYITPGNLVPRGDDVRLRGLLLTEHAQGHPDSSGMVPEPSTFHQARLRCLNVMV